MRNEPWMVGEPRLGRLGDVARAVVHDEVDHQCLVGAAIDLVEELDEVRRVVALDVTHHHLTGVDDRRGDEARRAVSAVFELDVLGLSWPRRRVGCRRDFAWTTVFSSTESTRADSGGER